MPSPETRTPEVGEARPELLRHVALTPEGPQLRPGLAWSPRHPAGVMVRPLVLGICRSDYKEAARQRQGASQFGHEVVGEVVARWGKAPFEVGEWVCLDPNRPLNRGTAFADLMPADGTQQELTEALHRVPGSVRLERAVFAEPLACAVHCLDQVTRALGGQVSGSEVLVVGAGIAGTLIALSAQAAGATVSLRNAGVDKLEFLRVTGLLPAGALGQDEPPRTPPRAIVLRPPSSRNAGCAGPWTPWHPTASSSSMGERRPRIASPRTVSRSSWIPCAARRAPPACAGGKRT
jgi:cyclitol reductase